MKLYHLMMCWNDYGDYQEEYINAFSSPEKREEAKQNLITLIQTNPQYKDIYKWYQKTVSEAKYKLISSQDKKHYICMTQEELESIIAWKKIFGEFETELDKIN